MCDLPPVASSVTIVMRLRSLSNGSSLTTRCELTSDSRGMPALRREREQRPLGGIAHDAPTRRPLWTSLASLQSAAVAKSWPSGPSRR